MTEESRAQLRAQAIRPPVRIARAIELIEARSAWVQHRCAPPVEAERLGLRAERFGSASIVLTRRSTNLYYNRVVGLGQASPATPSQVDRAIALAREHGVKVLAVSLGATARPRRLKRWLLDRRFEPVSPSAKLWRDATPLPAESREPSVHVRPVLPKHASTWVDVVSAVWRVFGYRRDWFEARVRTPGWRHYLAWCDGEPVAAGALYVDEVAGLRVGHLVDGVTLKPWRRRGAQRAIIRRRVADGLADGCELFTSETAPPLPRMPLVSFRNLCRQGFQMAYLRQPWKLDLTTLP